MIKLYIALFLALFTTHVFAIGTTIAVVALGMVAGELATVAVAMAINMVVAAIVSKAFFNPSQPDSAGGGSSQSENPGNRQQIPPATDNKLPVVYGSSYVGGTIVDLSITGNSQQLFYVLALCEVTSTNSGQTPDTITFGYTYWGGKRVIFNANGYSVDALLDESTGIYDYTVAGKLEFFFYNNGYNSNTNSPYSAQAIMQSGGLTYTWDSTKLMSNCAFVIIKLTYSQTANIRGIEQTKFQITNSRTNTGDCFYDYLINTRYGAALPASQIDSTSLAALTTYSNQNFTYTTYGGSTATQPRFKFNGVIDTNRTIMDNLQDMTTCCDCQLKYNEVTAKWGVIVQQPTYTVAMTLDDSNMVSAITISPLDIASSYNIVECKFPDKTQQDAFNSTSFNLATIAPSLLYPNEPVNKVSLSLPLTNDSVTAQYIANRLLKAGREDLQVTVDVNFVGIQLDAGDIVSVTNANYGWTAKLFRINKLVQQFADDGAIIVKLTLSEFNPSVYDDVSVTQFSPAPNTGIGDPTFFGNLTAPYVYSSSEMANVPYVQIQAYTAPSGITQYVEIWYSAFSNPLATQMVFAGTSEVQSNGSPYLPFTLINPVTLSNVPAGNWYFFTRCVNSLASSSYSPASTLFSWRPRTFQYSERYLSVAYASDAVGTGFTFNPRGKTYYGLFNQNNSTPNTTASNYTWYLSPTAFNTTGALVYLLYTNRNDRRFSFSAGFAAYASGSGAFVPTSVATYDPSLWAGLPDGTNIIDLDLRTGQLTQTGTTSVGTGELSIINNADGTLRAQLQEYLDFGGAYTKTSSAALITIDVYGRVVGFETPDNFNYTEEVFTATAGQTVFTVTRASTYISGQCLVFSNGLLWDESQYTDTGGSTGTVTFGVGATAGDIITIISFRSVSASTLATTAASGTGTVATISFGARPTAPFVVGQSITVTGVTPAGYNGTYTVTACTTNSVSYANTTTGAQSVAGTVKYTNNTYTSLSRNSATLSNQATYTASGFTLNTGYELLFLNGTIVNAEDYDISGSDITFLANTTGDLQIIQWTPNNLGVANGTPVNVDVYTIVGQTLYSFTYNINSFNLYGNGCLYKQGTDYTTATNTYTLANSPTTNTNLMVQQTFARTGAA